MWIVALLVGLRVLPTWVPEVVAVIIKYGPAAYSVAKFLIQLINDLEKNHIIVPNQVPQYIPGYLADGSVGMIPNPDYQP